MPETSEKDLQAAAGKAGNLICAGLPEGVIPYGVRPPALPPVDPSHLPAWLPGRPGWTAVRTYRGATVWRHTTGEQVLVPAAPAMDDDAELLAEAAVTVTRVALGIPAGDLHTAVQALAASVRTATRPSGLATAAWILRHEDKHGEHVSLHATRESGLGALARTVRSRWGNIAGDTVNTPEGPVLTAPGTAEGLSDEEAVETYFQCRGGRESYSLYEEDVQGGRYAPAESYCRFCGKATGTGGHLVGAAEPGTNPWCCDQCWDPRLA